MSSSGPFDPPIGRQSSVVVLSRTFNATRFDYRLVTTISTRSSTEVLEINSTSGALLLAADHSFTDEASALGALSRQGFTEIARATAILGFTATETTAGVLLATKITPKATLPGGHVINLVSEARWELLPLEAASETTNYALTAEQEFWRSLQQHTVAGVHYYCETVDVTRPFPSFRSVTDPEAEFVWNSWLAQPFTQLGLVSHCPVLLQGAVEAVHEVHPTGQRYTLCLLSRRSRRHPGTRYIARGLNDLAGPGNEIEVELVIWTPSAGTSSLNFNQNFPSGQNTSNNNSNSVKWARTVWRRGTVPIWWGVELQPLNKGLQAEVYVRDSGPYVGMLTYFRNLQKMAVSDAHKSSKTEVLDSPAVICVNLLHCNPKKAAELMLSSHFQEGMKYVKERFTSGVASKDAPVTLMNFDWHGNMASLTEERAIEAFWLFIEGPVKQTGIAVGIMEPKREHNNNGHSNEDTKEDSTQWGKNWQMKWLQRQQGLLRYNCADSLDRTNGASCFAVLPALQEGLRVLGIPLDLTTAPAAMVQNSPLRAGAVGFSHSSSAASLSGSTGSLKSQEKSHSPTRQPKEEPEIIEILPEGWERRDHGGRAVYVDHVNRVTQWKPPEGTITQPRSLSVDNSITATTTANNTTNNASSSSSLPWAFFNYSLDDVRSRLYGDTVADYVTMFKKHGDVHSALYTGSPAMHSHVLGLVLPADARPYNASASVGKLQNLRVAVQRRWNNTVSDSARQQSMELFLGLNVFKHCPGIKFPGVQQQGPLNDLSGLDADDTLAKEVDLGEAHLGAELEKLHLRKHDGRLGLQEDLQNLEPLAPTTEDGSSSKSSSVEGDDSGGQALDPLGVLRSPPPSS